MTTNNSKKWELAILVCGLSGTLMTSILGLIQGFQSNEKLGLIQVSIQDTDDIRNALAKPLEGVYDFKLTYESFRGEEGKYESTGTGIFLWRPELQKYDIFLACSLDKPGEDFEEQIITWFFNSELPTDVNGEPKNPFDLKFIYQHRTSSYSKYKFAASRSVTMTEGNIIERNQENRAVTIEGRLDVRSTKGQILFKRKY